MKRPDGTWDPFDDYVLDFAVERNLYPVLCRDGRDEPIVHVVEDGALGGFTQLAQFGLAGQAGENLVHEPAGQDGAERQ